MDIARVNHRQHHRVIADTKKYIDFEIKHAATAGVSPTSSAIKTIALDQNVAAFPSRLAAFEAWKKFSDNANQKIFTYYNIHQHQEQTLARVLHDRGERVVLLKTPLSTIVGSDQLIAAYDPFTNNQIGLIAYDKQVNGLVKYAGLKGGDLRLEVEGGSKMHPASSDVRNPTLAVYPLVVVDAGSLSPNKTLDVSSLKNRAIAHWDKAQKIVQDFDNYYQNEFREESGLSHKNVLSASYELAIYKEEAAWGKKCSIKIPVQGDLEVLSGHQVPPKIVKDIRNRNDVNLKAALAQVETMYTSTRIDAKTTFPPRFSTYAITESGKPPHLRNLDTEVKFLEKMAHTLDPGRKYSPLAPAPATAISGPIWLRTKHPVCASCNYVMTEFKKTFPGIEIFVTDSKP